MKLSTDTGLRSGKIPIHFGLIRVNFGITECKKVNIALMGISYPALLCYILFMVG